MKSEQKHIMKVLNIELPNKDETNDDFIERLITERSQFLKDYLKSTYAKGYVLGISGGLDSFVASMLVKHAGLQLISVSLPYGRQKDINDAFDSVDVIQPYKFIIHNIEQAVDGHMNEISTIVLSQLPKESLNLIKGNVMARERMAVQYSYGSIFDSLVIGTDHATECVVGFYTKWGDGAADVNPLSGLTKDILYDMARYFNAPENIINKAPSAGLWDNQTDENELGLKYSDICLYLKGNEIQKDIAEKIESKFDKTEHKRHMPVDPSCKWWKVDENQKKTLIVIDAQNDFISGSLACQHSEEAVDNIVKYLNNNDHLNVVYTQDWHPYNHCSFIENGGTWPTHCVMNTEGSKLHKKFNLDVDNVTYKPTMFAQTYFKGTEKDIEEYSGYNAYRCGKTSRIKMNEYIHRDIIICGIATEFCVKETVLELLKNNFNVTILKDCLGYVSEEGHNETLKQLESMGAKIITSIN